MRGVSVKRPRGPIAVVEQTSVPWAGRVPKPAMDADSFVDYGSGFLRKSCDSCVSSKRRCDGQDPCTRCLRRKKPCHYTERKKCGPRSGQKTFRGPRRTRLSPDPAAAAAGTQQTPALQRHNTDATLLARLAPSSSGAPSKSTLESSYAGLRLGPAPPSHANPTLSAGELSGETTGVDYTDCSDGPPPQQMLNRDESGSSWWSLEEQAGGTAVSTLSTAGAARSTPWVQHGGRYAGDNNSVVGQFDGRGERQHWGGGAVGGAMSGVSGGSGGSGGDSSGDDSDEGLGLAEEEVAALLVRLGKTSSYFEGFPAGDVGARARSSAEGGADAHLSRDAEQRCWGVRGLQGRA